MAEIISTFNKMDQQVQDSVFVLWSGGGHPVLQTELHKVIDSIEDVIAVDFDTYIFCPSKFVIEFYHEGEVTIGIVGVAPTKRGKHTLRHILETKGRYFLR